MEPDEIPTWCFLTGQFLIHFENNKGKESYLSVHNDFLKSIITTPELKDFPYPNPGVFLMLCYGLLVYPLEFWKKTTNLSFKKIEAQIILDAKELSIEITNIIDLFEYAPRYPPPIKKSDFFRLLRNSIAHAYVKYDKNRDGFTFWNIRKNGDKNFETYITRRNLSIFLTGVGKYFINTQRH